MESFGNSPVSSSVIIKTESSLRRMSRPSLREGLASSVNEYKHKNADAIDFSNRVRTTRVNCWKKRALTHYFSSGIRSEKIFCIFLLFCLPPIFNEITNANLSIIKISAVE